MEQARATRIGRTPERGQNHRFLTKAVWINNNKLTNVANLDVFLNSILEYPEKLGWIDLSFNYITHLDPILQKYVNLKIIYLHGNKIDDFEELKILQEFPTLRSLTLHGNPISDSSNYRPHVLTILTQVSRGKLGFVDFVNEEFFLSVCADSEFRFYTRDEK